MMIESTELTRAAMHHEGHEGDVSFEEMERAVQLGGDGALEDEDIEDDEEGVTEIGFRQHPRAETDPGVPESALSDISRTAVTVIEQTVIGQGATEVANNDQNIACKSAPKRVRVGLRSGLRAGLSR